jgi:hypothetical protein
MVSDELERIRKEAVVACCEGTSQKLRGGTKESHKDNFRAEIRTEHLQNTSQRHYRCASLLSINLYSSPIIIRVIKHRRGGGARNVAYLWGRYENLRARRNLGDLGVDGRIILKKNLREIRLEG